MIDPDADFAVERGTLHVGLYDDGVQIHDGYGGSCVWLDAEALRWLQAVGLPAAAAALDRCTRNDRAEVPSDGPETMPSPTDGQIPGQTSIDEALAEAG